MKRSVTRHALFVVTFQATVCVVGCDASPTSGSQLVRLVPSGSVVVLIVDWGKVRRDGTLQRTLKLDRLPGAWQSMNIDPGAVERVVEFSDVRGAPYGISGMLLNGTFDTRGALQALQAGGWTAVDHAGRKIYHGPGGGSWLALARPRTFVAGSRLAVEAVVDVDAGRRERFVAGQTARSLAVRYGRGRHPVALIVAATPTAEGMAAAAWQAGSTFMDLSGLGKVTTVLERIGMPKGLGFGMTHVGDSYPVEIGAVMTSTTSAETVEHTLNLVTRWTDVLTPPSPGASDKAELTFSRAFAVERRGTLVSVKMAMDQADVRP